MKLGYAEQQAIAALERAEQDWVKAARLLQDMARTDHALLLSLCDPYLNGAAAAMITRVTKLQQQLEAPATAKPNKSSKKNSTPPKVTLPLGGDKKLSGNVFDAIINQMQANADLDAAAHEKSLRVVAKAFLAQRLDKYLEKRAQATKK
jgi:hypothetical protein